LASWLPRTELNVWEIVPHFGGILSAIFVGSNAEHSKGVCAPALNAIIVENCTSVNAAG
jgi:hypothetical protein